MFFQKAKKIKELEKELDRERLIHTICTEPKINVTEERIAILGVSASVDMTQICNTEEAETILKRDIACEMQKKIAEAIEIKEVESSRPGIKEVQATLKVLMPGNEPKQSEVYR